MNTKKIQRKQVEKLDKSWANNIASHLLSNKHNRVIYMIISISVALIILSCSVAFLSQVKSFTISATESHLMETTILSSENIDANLQSELQHLNHLATELSDFHSLTKSQIYEITQADISRHSHYHRIGLVYNDGNTYYTDSQSQNIASLPFFSQIIQGISGVTIIKNEQNEYQLLYYLPILKDTQIIGGIIVEANISQLTYFTPLTAMEDKAHSLLVFPEDNFFLQTQSDEVNNQPLSSSWKQHLVSVITNNEASAIYPYEAADGNGYLIAYQAITHLEGGYVVSIISQANILMNAKPIFTFTYILVGIILIFTALAYFYIQKIKRDSFHTFEYLSYKDSLTGYSSWAKFEIDVDHLMRQHQDDSSKKSNYYFLYSNIEKFKLINDIHGFDIGNKLLCHIGNVLSKRLDKDEPFTRNNADRYTLLMRCKNDYELLNRLENISADISAFSKENELGINVVIKFGIYKITDTARPVSAMSDRALLALQNITNDNTAYYGFYSSSIRQKALMEKELENDMFSALQNREFVLYLQPKFNLDSQEVVGAEALVRWLHPRRGLISPTVFISLFEKNGFIVELDNYMFEESCKLLGKWIKAGIKPIPISVNISKAHLYNPSLTESLYNLTVKYDIPPQLLEIELTESMDFNNLPMLLEIVNRLKALHFSVSIDDFGTGYSSLNLLKDLPVDVLKIDREFFAEAADEQRGRDIITSIIDMVKRLNMKTVAEGVEHKEQVDFLLNAQCDLVQGFYFSQPIPVADFEEKYLNYSASQSISSQKENNAHVSK